MSNSLPYITSALYDWIEDNNCSPHIVFKSNHPGVVIPAEQLDPNETVLNISHAAIKNLKINTLGMQFLTSFQGKISHIILPLESLIAIYAIENGEGFLLQNFQAIHNKSTHISDETIPEKQNTIQKTKKQKPTLTIIK